MGENSPCEGLNATVKCSWSDSPGVSSLKDWCDFMSNVDIRALNSFRPLVTQHNSLLYLHKLSRLYYSSSQASICIRRHGWLAPASASTFIMQHVEEEQDRFQLLKHKQHSAFIHFVFCLMWHNVNLQQCSFVFLCALFLKISAHFVICAWAFTNLR